MRSYFSESVLQSPPKIPTHIGSIRRFATSVPKRRQAKSYTVSSPTNFPAAGLIGSVSTALTCWFTEDQSIHLSHHPQEQYQCNCHRITFPKISCNFTKPRGQLLQFFVRVHEPIFGASVIRPSNDDLVSEANRSRQIECRATGST
eukprot:m.254004 g.254004  ORF g.254004 m.254004 type:complete len:146 (-) comp15937_c0_seq7:231-668(-)